MTIQQEEKFIIDTAQKLIIKNLSPHGPNTNRISDFGSSTKNDIIKKSVESAIILAKELKMQLKDIKNEN